MSETTGPLGINFCPKPFWQLKTLNHILMVNLDLYPRMDWEVQPLLGPPPLRKPMLKFPELKSELKMADSSTKNILQNQQFRNVSSPNGLFLNVQKNDFCREVHCVDLFLQITNYTYLLPSLVFVHSCHNLLNMMGMVESFKLDINLCFWMQEFLIEIPDLNFTNYLISLVAKLRIVN